MSGLVAVRHIGGPADNTITSHSTNTITSHSTNTLGYQVTIRVAEAIGRAWLIDDNPAPTSAMITQTDHVYDVYRTGHGKAIAVHSSVPHNKVGAQHSTIGMPQFILADAPNYLRQKLNDYCARPHCGVLYAVEADTVRIEHDETRQMYYASGIAVARMYGPTRDDATFTPWHERLTILLDIEAEKEWAARKAIAARVLVRELEQGRPISDAANIAGREAGIL